MKNQPLFLIEFYTTNPADRTEGGWEINFAWVYAPSEKLAWAKLNAAQGSRVDTCIQIGSHSEITPLGGNFRINTPDANLFIYH